MALKKRANATTYDPDSCIVFNLILKYNKNRFQHNVRKIWFDRNIEFMRLVCLIDKYGLPLISHYYRTLK